MARELEHARMKPDVVPDALEDDAFQIVVQQGPGHAAQGADPFSVRIRPQAAVRPGRVVRLSFTPPDGGPALQALALLVREEPQGAIYFFADLNAPAVSRLSTPIARLQSA